MDEINEICSRVQININFAIEIKPQLFFSKVAKTNEHQQLNHNLA